MIIKTIFTIIMCLSCLVAIVGAKAQESDFVRAKVIKVNFTGKNQAQPPEFEQFVDVEFLEGAKKGQKFEFLQYNRTLPSTGEVPNYQQLNLGDEIVLIKTSNTEYQVDDKYRLGNIAWILGFVIGIFVVFYRKKALLSLACLIGTIFAIANWLIPVISSGQDPVIWSLGISSLVMLVSILVTHGFNKISYSALVSVLITILATSIFGVFAIQFGQMQGNSEYNIFLQSRGLDLRGVLFAGILIGTLGVLDDIAITQAICVDQSNENHLQNAIKMGTEHLGSMINTLALAYLGSFLPALLVLTDSKSQEGRPLWIVLNSELLQAEIIRTIVGVFALLIIVPISTVVSLIFIKKYTLKQIWQEINFGLKKM